MNLHRRKLDFSDFESMMADVDSLRQTGYQRVGKWDLSQILDHVGHGAKVAMEGSPHRAAWLIRRLIAPLIFKKMLRTRRMKEGIKVPSWWLPDGGRDEATAIADFKEVVQRFRSFRGPTREHPFFGPLDYKDWTDLILIHGAHHLSFLVAKP